MRRLVALALGLIILLPGAAAAYSVQDVGSTVAATTSNHLYRLRAVGKTWQLSALSADSLEAEPIVFNDRLLLTVVNGSQTKVVSSNGLDYRDLPGLSGDAIRLRRLTSAVIVLVQNGSEIKANLINDDFTVQPLPGLTPESLDQADRFFQLGDDLFYGEAINDSLRIQRFQAGVWSIATGFSCPASQLVTKPLLAWQCADSQVYYPLIPTDYQRIFDQTVSGLVLSSNWLAAVESPTDIALWQTGQLTTYALPLGNLTITQLTSVGGRLFIQLSDNSWTEFDLASGHLLPAPGDLASLTAAENNSRVFVKIGTDYFVSDQVGQWSVVTVAGDFDRLRLVRGGYLAWQTGADLAQFAVDGSTVFQPVDSSWSSSSQIQSVYSRDAFGLILLLNASHNPNLYQTTDFQHWSRITLPTTATVVVSVAQARALPANSLAEIGGVISVASGIVSSEALYLQDQTGGMQIFLDSSKGSLPTGGGRSAVADGQISSSQTKRLLLTASDDIVLGDSAPVTLTNLGVDELSDHLGLAAVTEAVIAGSAKDYYSLATQTGNLKFHFPPSQLDFGVGDTVKLPLVTDYNSSSGTVEGWYLGSGAALVSSPSQTPAAEAVSSPAPSLNSSPAAKATPSVKTATVVTTRSTGNTSALTAPVTTLPVAAPIKTLVSGQSTNDTTQTAILAFASFIVGALASQGRRLRRWWRLA